MAKETIRLYLCFTLVTKLGVSFISATYVVFLISKGLNLFEVNLVNFVFFTTLFICEIPTGVVADVFGRKISYVCSCFLFGIGMFAYAISDSFWGFALAEAIGAVGYTFSSGAFQAWLVDRLKHQGFSGSLGSVFTKEQQLTNVAPIIGALGGAFLADKNLVFPWIVGGCVMFIAGIAAILFIKEEYFVRQSFSFLGGLQSMKDTVKASIHYGVQSKVVRFILLMGAVQFFAVQAPNMQWQPFFSQFLSDKTSLGFLFGGMSVCLAIGSTLSPWFLRKIRSEKLSLIVSQIFIGTGILLTAFMNLLPTALVMFLLHEIARGLFRPLKDVYLNDNIPSKERATLISFESISRHIGGMIGLVVSGYVAEYGSIQMAWVLSGCVLIGVTLILSKNGGNS